MKRNVVGLVRRRGGRQRRRCGRPATKGENDDQSGRTSLSAKNVNFLDFHVEFLRSLWQVTLHILKRKLNATGKTWPSKHVKKVTVVLVYAE